MIVIFSHDAFFQRYGGVSRCVVELMPHLEGRNQPWQALAGRYASCFLKRFADTGSDNVVGMWRANSLGRIAAVLHNEPRFALAVRRMHNVVVHRTYYPIADLLPVRVPVIVTLHDMYWEASGRTRSIRHRLQSWLKRRALNRADRIVCISHFTSSELARIWPELANKSEVIYHGVNPLASNVIHDAPTRSRFLFVGDRAGRKNFAMALAGLAVARVDDQDLMCIGGGPFSATEQAMIAAHQLTGRVMQQDADDAGLAAAYSTATALLYPSNYEGFGMPLLEAMLHSCPVIASRAACLPEVGGDAALYADPNDPVAWAAAIRKVTVAATRAELIARGCRRAKDFSWENVASRYVAVYQSVKKVKHSHSSRSATLSKNHW